MIHDLQIVDALVRRPVREVRAAGMPVLTDRVDIANARIEFEGGCVANLTASRVSTEPMRKLRIFAPPLYCSIDMHGRTVAAHRLVREGGHAGVADEPIPVAASDPLGSEIADFARGRSRRRGRRSSRARPGATRWPLRSVSAKRSSATAPAPRSRCDRARADRARSEAAASTTWPSLETSRKEKLETPFGAPSDSYFAGDARRRSGRVPVAPRRGASPVADRDQLPGEHLRLQDARLRRASLGVGRAAACRRSMPRGTP